MGRDRIGCIPVAPKDVGRLVVFSGILTMSPEIIISFMRNCDRQEDEQRHQRCILASGGPAGYHLERGDEQEVDVGDL